MKIVHSYEEITDWFFAALEELQKTKQTICVGLAGGTSFDGWYLELMKNETRLPDGQEGKMKNYKEVFGMVRWCVTDERVNCDMNDRNDAHIWEVFLRPLCEMGLSKEEYFLRPEMDDNGLRYSERVGEIDISFFGMGSDGHTASLFPHHEALRSQELGFIKINNSPKPPPERISLSPQSLQILERVCLFAVGSQKKEAFARFLDDSILVEDCPVKLLKPEIVLDLTRE